MILSFFTQLFKKGLVRQLEGWDTFSGESYPMKGAYHTKQQAQKAARAYLKELEKLQPAKTSGGQSGIQDQVYLISPEGMRSRFLL